MIKRTCTDCVQLCGPRAFEVADKLIASGHYLERKGTRKKTALCIAFEYKKGVKEYQSVVLDLVAPHDRDA